MLDSFKEEQGGQCGWSPVSEGMEEMRSKMEVRLGFSSVAHLCPTLCNGCSEDLTLRGDVAFLQSW